MMKWFLASLALGLATLSLGQESTSGLLSPLHKATAPTPATPDAIANSRAIDNMAAPKSEVRPTLTAPAAGQIFVDSTAINARPAHSMSTIKLVPEPAPWIFFGLAGLGFFGVARRRRSIDNA